jgi:hypothetical protein
MFPVVPLEVLLGVALDPVRRPFRVHEVRVRLFPARQRRARIVDRPLVGVPLADLVPDKIQNQLLPLRGVQLARQGDFDLPVGRAVRAFVPVGGGPEQGGFVFGPCGQIAVPGRFQVFVARPLGVVTLAGDVGGVAARLALPANLHAAMVGGHVWMPEWSWFVSVSRCVCGGLRWRCCRLSFWCVLGFFFGPPQGRTGFREAETTKCAFVVTSAGPELPARRGVRLPLRSGYAAVAAA